MSDKMVGSNFGLVAGAGCWWYFGFDNRYQRPELPLAAVIAAGIDNIFGNNICAPLLGIFQGSLERTIVLEYCRSDCELAPRERDWLVEFSRGKMPPTQSKFAAVMLDQDWHHDQEVAVLMRGLGENVIELKPLGGHQLYLFKSVMEDARKIWD